MTLSFSLTHFHSTAIVVSPHVVMIQWLPQTLMEGFGGIEVGISGKELHVFITAFENHTRKAAALPKCPFLIKVCRSVYFCLHLSSIRFINEVLIIQTLSIYSAAFGDMFHFMHKKGNYICLHILLTLLYKNTVCLIDTQLARLDVDTHRVNQVGRRILCMYMYM